MCENVANFLLRAFAYIINCLPLNSDMAMGNLLTVWQVFSYASEEVAGLTSQQAAIVLLQGCYFPFGLVHGVSLSCKFSVVNKPQLSDAQGSSFTALHVCCISVVSGQIISLFQRLIQAFLCILRSLI